MLMCLNHTIGHTLTLIYTKIYTHPSSHRHSHIKMCDKRQQYCLKHKSMTRHWNKTLKRYFPFCFVWPPSNMFSQHRNSELTLGRHKIMEKPGETQRAYLWLMKLDAIEENISELGYWSQVHDCRWLCHPPADGQLIRNVKMHLSKQRPPHPIRNGLPIARISYQNSNYAPF